MRETHSRRRRTGRDGLNFTARALIYGFMSRLGKSTACTQFDVFVLCTGVFRVVVGRVCPLVYVLGGLLGWIALCAFFSMLALRCRLALIIASAGVLDQDRRAMLGCAT